jgi:hypothetical protein
MRPGNIGSLLRMTDMQANMQQSIGIEWSNRREGLRSSASVARCICKCALQRHYNALVFDSVST